MPVEMRDEVRYWPSAAEKEGESVSVYVRRAIREQVRRDKLRRSAVI